jgi:hypothetical protein
MTPWRRLPRTERAILAPHFGHAARPYYVVNESLSSDGS